MRIWIDLSAPAHPVVFRPLVRRLRAAGHEVEVTARDFAQTLELAQIAGLDALAVGKHGGRSSAGKLRSLAGRSAALWRWARGRPPFDLAAAHGSNDLPVVARALRVPAVDLFDYEWATFQHMIGCRLARRVIVPDSIPPERLERYGVGPRKLRRYPGLKEEYFLHDFEPDPGILEAVGADAGRIVVVLRTPPVAALYHRVHNPLYADLLDRLGHDASIHAVVLPRLREQAEELRRLALPSVIVPEHAVDGPSLVAASDLVISAGGSMNREAVALGVPVYTTFQGRMGGVDEKLMREGRLRRLEQVSDIELRRRDRSAPRLRRDPQLIVDLILGTLASDAAPVLLQRVE
jgi:predicted glycosyltransferase